MAVTVTRLGSYIGNQWLVPTSSRESPIHPRNPANLTLGDSYLWRPEYAARAIGCAETAFPRWSKTPFDERVAALNTFFIETLARHRDELARFIPLEMGKPLPQALEEFDAVRRRFSLMVDDARALLEPRPHPESPRIVEDHLPFGVTAVIAPWNYPLRIPMLMALAALLTGNTVVLKPASNTPGVLRRMIELALEDGASLPAGVFNFLVGPGSVGQALAESPDVDLLLFTGSAEVGARIKGAAAKTTKKLTMEMVGQGAVIVLKDVDVGETAATLVKAAMCRNGGQNCNATRMVVVEGEELGRRLEDAIQAEIKRLIVGDPFTAGVHLGPMATDPKTGFLRDLQAVVSSTGARIVYEHPLREDLVRDPNHWFVGPRLYRIPRSGLAALFREDNVTEVFGPALGIAVARSADEAVDLVNRMAGRLSAGVYSRDLERGLQIARQIRWGQVHVNTPTVGAPGEAAFGGPGWATYGGFGGRDLPRQTVWSRRLVLPTS